MNFYLSGFVLSDERGKKMDDISALIKEAKPLYFARKKRNNIIKTTLAGLCLLWVGVVSYNPVSDSPYTYYWDNEFSVGDRVSVIEEMGLPTDEYGLLMIG